MFILEVLILTDSFTQSLQKKLEALENDFAVHEIRVQNVCAQGEDILSKVRYTPGIPGQKKGSSKSDWTKYRIMNIAKIMHNLGNLF